MIGREKGSAFDWIAGHRSDLSDWHRLIWGLAEPAFREYRSAAWYVERLRAEGFDVETGSGGMPTAFCATWGDGGPVLATYAEYDAVPGNCQAAVAEQRPRAGLSRHAAGHTDPHSALGLGALAGVLATKAAMEAHGLGGRLKFLGEPAEKLIASKPVHAAKGYYDDIDAAVSFHPAYMLPLFNTTVWDTHCGCGFTRVYAFESEEPASWLSGEGDAPMPVAHASARPPGALDAVVQMFQSAKAMREHVVDATVPWSMNEFIMTGGQATADNLPASIGLIQYVLRVPDLALADRVLRALDHAAAHVAALNHCRWEGIWVARTRPGLPNHAMARLAYENLAEGGTPAFGADAVEFARAIQSNLGLEPMEDPYHPACGDLIEPEAAEASLRGRLPPDTHHFTSDDYVEYTWHAPTARLYVGRPMLRAPAAGYRYPDWVMNALGGFPAAIDPMILAAGRAIAGTFIDLLLEPDRLARAKAEFDERTGGGIGGTRWLTPRLPADFAAPIDLPWPEYATTPRGEDWVIPARVS